MLKKNEAIETETESVNEVKQVSQDRQQTPGVLLVLGAIARGVLQIILMVAVLAGAFYGMNYLINSGEKPPKRPAFKTVYTVDSQVVAAGNFQPTMVIYGEIVASRKVDLRSLVSGEVTSVNEKLKAGAMITRGESLLEIDRFNYEGALREARANIAETEARIAEYDARILSEQTKLKSLESQLLLAQNDFQRFEVLRDNGTATQKQVDDRSLILSQRDWSVSQTTINLDAENAKLAQQKAILEKLKWREEQASRNLSDTVLQAPFTGIVSNSQVEVGKMVGANDVVVSIYEADKLDVRFTLTDQRFGRIRSDNDGLIGRKAEVIWVVGGKEHRFPAKIERIGAQITSDRGGVEVFATIEGSVDKSALRPGAFVEVHVPDKTFADHFKVPESSLYNGDTAYIVVDGKLVEKSVSVSGYDGDFALVQGGLSSGDEVLVTRIAEISSGLSVKTEKQAKAATENRNRGRGAFAALSDEDRKKAVRAILEKNNITPEKWGAMKPREKGPLIGAYMREQASKAKQ